MTDKDVTLIDINKTSAILVKLFDHVYYTSITVSDNNDSPINVLLTQALESYFDPKQL